MTQDRLYTPSFFLIAGANLFTVASQTCFFLFPLFITQRGGSKADIGILMGVMALSSVLSRPWISNMVDRIGRKRSYSAGCLIMGLTPLAYLPFDGPLEEIYWPLFVIRLIHGLGISFCFTSSFTYVADIIPESRLNEGIGMFGTTALLGMALGPFVAELVIRRFGFSTLFYTGAALGFLALIMHQPLPESYRSAPGQQTVGFFTVLAQRKILTITGMALLFGAGLAAYGSFVAPFGQQLGLEMVSLYFLSYSAAAIITRFFGGRLADRVGEERILPYALFITGSGLAVLVLLNGAVMLVVAGLIMGAGHGLLFPSLNALAIRNEPIGVRGKINGVFTGGIDTGVLIGAVCLGYLGEWAGYRVLFLTAGAAVWLGLAVYRLGLAGSMKPQD